METIKYALIPIVWAISTVFIAIHVISFLVKKLAKKDTSVVKKKMLRAFTCSIVTFAIIATYDNSENPSDTSMNDLPTATYGESIPIDAEQSVNNTSTPGSSVDNPITITAEQLALEIEENIILAKESYNGKWVKITGTISDTSDAGVAYGYYLFGEKSTSGYTGIQIMCWCDDGPYSGSVLGDTQTFIGQVLEITTFNVTEIVDCQRVTE